MTLSFAKETAKIGDLSVHTLSVHDHRVNCLLFDYNISLSFSSL